VATLWCVQTPAGFV